MANGKFGEIDVRGAAGHADEIFKHLFFGVGSGEKLVSGGVRAADIACVPRIAPAHVLGRALQQQNARHDVARGERGGQCGIAASNHNYVKRVQSLLHIEIAVQPTRALALSSKGQRR